MSTFSFVLALLAAPRVENFQKNQWKGSKNSSFKQFVIFSLPYL